MLPRASTAAYKDNMNFARKSTVRFYVDFSADYLLDKGITRAKAVTCVKEVLSKITLTPLQKAHNVCIQVGHNNVAWLVRRNERRGLATRSSGAHQRYEQYSCSRRTCSKEDSVAISSYHTDVAKVY